MHFSDGRSQWIWRTLVVLVVLCFHMAAASPPTFSNLPASMSLGEGQAIGTFVYQVLASASGGGSIVYNISSITNDSTPSFSIASDGRLTTAAILDADVGSPVEYVIEIEACDVTLVQCSYGNLTVTITEGNDPPVFTPSALTLSVPENMTVGTLLTKSWSIYDEDGAFEFSYSIDNSTIAPSYFEALNPSGDINLTSSLDYENTTNFPNNQVVIVLRAADPQGLEATLTITVQITDVNDCTPVFSTSECSANLLENRAVGTQILVLEASDDDLTTEYASFNFSVLSPYDATYELLATTNTSAALVTKQIIDRETIDNLLGVTQVVVEVRDTGGLATSMVCTLTVEDENEFAPVLEQDVYQYYIRYDAGIGTSVDRLAARDDDYTGRPLEYTAYDLPSELFVSYYGGQVMIAGALTRGATYSFTVNVTDRGNPPKTSNTAEVIVRTFDPVPYLTDWAVDTGGNYFSQDDEDALVAAIATTCAPCSPKVASVFQSTVNSDHFVARVYIAIGYSNSSAQTQMFTTEQVLSMYTTGDGKTPTDIAAQLGPGTYPVVSIQETYSVNWWLETPEGIATTCLLCIAGAALLTAGTAFIVYKYYWKYRPENRQYLEYDG